MDANILPGSNGSTAAPQTNDLALGELPLFLWGKPLFFPLVSLVTARLPGDDAHTVVLPLELTVTPRDPILGSPTDGAWHPRDIDVHAAGTHWVGPVEGQPWTLDMGNGVTLEFVWMAPGTFVMGSQDCERDRQDEETPHDVTLTHGFWMGKYEITQTQWRQIMGNDPSHFEGPAKPVECVSWYDGQIFAQRLTGRHPGVHFRLPTEAEWEYACRSTQSRAFYFGWSLNASQANFDGNYPYRSAKGIYRGETVDVGKFEPNGSGLFDMHGNVYEWCQDWYGLYATTPVTNPVGPAMGFAKILRGGCWNSDGGFCRSAFRERNHPACRSPNNGLRLVATLRADAETQ